MSKLQELMTVVSQREVACNIYELVVKGDLVQEMKLPGQFLHLAVPQSSMLLRRPISISSWDKATSTCSLLYRIGDETTGTYALSKLTQGETVDVMGPLGNGFPISEITPKDHVLLVGGGIGVPPLYELAKQLEEKDCQMTVLLGFATEKVKILEAQFARINNVTLRVATDDGSYGYKGHVGMLMEELALEPTAVYTCGAPGMLKAVARKYDHIERLYISMESRMACGIGACYACVEHDRKDPNHALKVCEDGPVFLGKQIAL